MVVPQVSSVRQAAAPNNLPGELAVADGVDDCSRRRTSKLALLAILVLAVVVRMGGIERPLVGNFATKNAVYGMIARNWARGEAPWWRPTVDCLVHGHKSAHLLEVPLSAYLAGGLWKLLGGRLDVWGRLVSVLASAAAVLLLHGLVSRRVGVSAANGAALALALSPVGIIYGQSFMLEAPLMALSIATLAAVDRAARARCAGWLLVAAVGFAAVLLMKIYMLVLIVPMMALAFGTESDGESAEVVKRWRFVALGAAVMALAATPAIVWFGWAYRAGGEPGAAVFYSVRDSAQVHAWPPAILGEAAFYRQLLDDAVQMVLTPLGFGLALLGVVWTARQRLGRTFWIWTWAASSVLLGVALPQKFFALNYYWCAALPPWCVLAGMGWEALSTVMAGRTKSQAFLLAVWIVLALRYAAGPAYRTPAEDRAVVQAADQVRLLTNESEPVVTFHGSTLDLLYYCDRPGWALSADDPQLPARLAEARSRARFAVVVGKPPAKWKAAPIAGASGYAIYRLADLD